MIFALKTQRLRKIAVVIILLVGVAAIIFVNQVSSSDQDISGGGRSGFKIAMPSVAGSTATSSWFCPGVPGRDENVKSEIIVANPTQTPITGTITWLSSDNPALSTTLIVDPLSRRVFDATSGRKSEFLVRQSNLTVAKQVLSNESFTLPETHLRCAQTKHQIVGFLPMGLPGPKVCSTYC